MQSEGQKSVVVSEMRNFSIEKSSIYDLTSNILCLASSI